MKALLIASGILAVLALVLALPLFGLYNSLVSKSQAVAQAQRQGVLSEGPVAEA